MAISRNQSHFVIMTVIYDELADFVMGGGASSRNANELIEEIAETPFDEVDPYIKRSVALTMQHYGEIVDAFRPMLVNWKWERIPLLTQAILLMSYAHFYYVEKVDKKVVINTAVDLAKKYVEEKQAKFINAILDGVLQ
ncbi:MAG: transcription antitermination protein NusB [Bacilli bacterium]|nr:transcription antitermination protein NusB [Bacilli bacterium]